MHVSVISTLIIWRVASYSKLCVVFQLAKRIQQCATLIVLWKQCCYGYQNIKRLHKDGIIATSYMYICSYIFINCITIIFE